MLAAIQQASFELMMAPEKQANRPPGSLYNSTIHVCMFHGNPSKGCQESGGPSDRRINFNVSISMDVMEKFFMKFLHFSMYEMDNMSYLQMYFKFMDIMKEDIQYTLTFLDDLLKSETIMKKLKEEKYDLLLSDPIYTGSELIADILGLPLVFSLRFSTGNNWERHCGQVPAPPSFVPGAMSKLTDKMNFFERVQNFLFYTLQDVMIDYTYWKKFDNYHSKVKGE